MHWIPYPSHTSHHPSQTFCLSWISYATQKLMLNSCKMDKNQSVAFFPSLKQNCIAYRSSSRHDCLFEFPQVWQSGLSRVHSNSCCSCWFEPEILIISQSYHKMYSNNILNFQESATNLNPVQKSLETYWIHHVRRFSFFFFQFFSGFSQDSKVHNSAIYIYICIYIYIYIYIYITWYSQGHCVSCIQQSLDRAKL